MPGRGRGPLIVAVVLVLAVAGGILAWLFWPPPARVLPDGLTNEQARELIERKNVGLGQLENQQLEEGIEVFTDIAKSLPDDPLGFRNVAVARITDLGEDDEPFTPEEFSAAQESLDRLKDVEGESPAYHRLMLKLAIASKDVALAEAHAAALLRAEPDSPDAPYAVYLAARDSDDAQVRAKSGEAINRAYELNPGNLWIVADWFGWTSQTINAALPRRRPTDEERQAAHERLAGQFPGLAERIARAREALKPIAYEGETFARYDPLGKLDAAVEAARQEDFTTLARALFELQNIVRPAARVDLRAVKPHPLEFVLEKFEPEFYRTYDLAELAPTPAIPVSLEAAAEWQLPADLQKQLGEVRGLVLADFELDGGLDVWTLSSDAVGVFGRTGEDDPWQLLARADVPDGMTGLIAQDFDLDFDENRAAVGGAAPPGGEASRSKCQSADVDLLVYGAAGVRLYENRYESEERRRTLELVETPELARLSSVRTAAAGDFDADGDLDLVVADESGMSVWSGRGNRHFFEISERSTLPPADWRATSILTLDWDRDVDIDVVVTGEGGAGWLENLRHGQFRWRPFDGPFAAAGRQSALDVVDADANASWDLIAGGAEGIVGITTSRRADSPVRAMETVDVSDQGTTGLRTWDYDNDGALDIVAWNQEDVSIHRGLSDAAFSDVDLFDRPLPRAAAAEPGDLDADGDLDLVVARADGITFLRNDGGNANHWIALSLQAQQVIGQDPSQSGRVNAHGVGSLLELKSGTRYQARVVRGQSTHFGLGPRKTADVIRVLWLNGVPQNLVRPQADQVLCEQQVLTGSCPYLYTWDGERFVFVTDLLWAAPLGLQAAEGELLPWRDWEYLKIPGGALRPRDGQYVLQLTEELWEATYFDEVRLIAVDHPADVEIYSNEKVGPAEIAQFKIHTVRAPRAPAAATNHRGRDILPEIARRDDVYVRAFDEKLRQGLVEEHFLELDLGDLRGAETITLFLTGWVYPTGVSLNVALSQNPELGLPKPPSLHVPDGRGGWQEALPFMGFPGGKTKTIAVDLSGLFQHGDYRVRVATSMELYWDHIFFTADEAPVEVRTTELELVAADLHFRGFSRIEHPTPHGPERFVYDDVTVEPKWPPMLGNFTRYGDAAELLRTSDDRLLVMGAGDEATLRFADPGPPPSGWKRDFLIYNDGWDKDCNLTTVLGETVEPLPFRRMSGFPWPPGEPVPDSEEYRAYLRQYQTRQQSDTFWQTIRRRR